jgi:predicted ATP-dependent serine protease
LHDVALDINGDTGIGKSILTFDIAAAVAAGSGLMRWSGSGKPKRGIVFDGEMPTATFQERIKLLQTIYGPGLKFYGYNRNLMAQEGEELHPFNTSAGQKWLWREIDAIKPDLIVFDSIMCLTSGELSGEEA